MEEIEVEEYVRTENGNIYKETDCEIIDNEVITYAGGEYMVSDTIVKHSKNLIDLIEVGDIVEIKERISCFRNVEKIPIFDIGTLIAIKNGIAKYTMKIVSVLTHEQFEQNSYKVGGVNKI